MAEDPTAKTDRPDKRRAELHARRREQRRRRARRRLAAGLALAAVALAVAAVLLVGGSDTDNGRAPTHRAGTTYPELFVGRADFSRQMDWLDRNGYEAVTLEEVERAWYRGGTLPAKPVVLSFDDGYRPQFTFALPELRKHGWPGLLNLKAEGSDLYTSNVEAMIDAGWELAAHTIHHLDLTTLDAPQLKEEVAGSRRS
jgi:hypothetical protein